MHASMNINASNHECTVLRASTSLIVGPPTILGRLWVLLPQIVQKNPKVSSWQGWNNSSFFWGVLQWHLSLPWDPVWGGQQARPLPAAILVTTAPPPFLLFSSILFLKGAFWPCHDLLAPQLGEFWGELHQMTLFLQLLDSWLLFEPVRPRQCFTWEITRFNNREHNYGK